MTVDLRAFPDVVTERLYSLPFERAAYSAIMQSVPHGVLLVDARMHIALANRAAAALFGRPMTRLRRVPIVQLLPRETVDLLLRDSGPRRLRVVETCLLPLPNHPSARSRSPPRR